MQKAFSLVLWILVLTTFGAARAGTPVHLWSQRFGSTGADYAVDVAADPSGNVAMTGYFNGTVNFGGGNLVSVGTSGNAFLASYNDAGVHRWSRRFSSTAFTLGTAVAADPDGGVVAAGYFEGTANFGGADLTSAGSRDIYVVKYDAAGVHQWSRRIGGTGWESTVDVALDGSGNVVVTGAFEGTVDFGGGGLTSAAGTDIFLARYNSAGGHLWSQRFGGTWDDIGTGVAARPDGTIVLTGTFGDTVDFGGGGLAAVGMDDVFLASYSLHGVHAWSRSFGNTSSANARCVAMDGSGNILLAGDFVGTANFGGGNLVSGGYTDLFVARYDDAGTHQWSIRHGGLLNEYGYGIAADAAGNAVVTGSFTGNVSFGGATFRGLGEADGFLACYGASDGAHQKSLAFGAAWTDRGRGVAVDAGGNVSLAGSFAYTVNLGGNDLTSAGTDDILLARFGPGLAEPEISSIDDIGNDQGRRVKVRFLRSGYDAAGSTRPIISYDVYRRDQLPAAGTAAVPAGFRREELAAAGWTFVGSAPAHHESSYGLDVPTLGDSEVGGSSYFSVFYVRAATADPVEFFDSEIDSGFSIDNLAPGAPADLSISNHPNPFNPATTLRYTVPSRGPVSIAVFDARGERIATIADRVPHDAGEYRVEWTASRDGGGAVPSGVYFVRIEHDGVPRTRKVVVLK